jgi:predicted NBD/HSP70 family sugar kinase
MCLDSSHVTVSKALQYLESSGDIVPTDTIVPNGSGRPSDVFSLRADAFHGIGIHFEPGYARVVLLNAAKSVVDRWTISLPDRYQKEAEVRQTLRDVSGRAVSLARDLIDPGTLRSISLSLPGFVDTAECIWRGGLLFGNIQNLDIRQILKGVAKVRFDAEDTSRSLTHYQLMTGRETEAAQHFLVINLGIGLGAGIVMDGDVFLGNGGIVGEIGHIPFKNNSSRCACGNLGCAETMLSATGIRTVFADRLGQGVRSLLNDRVEASAPPTIDEILQAAEGGDHFTRSTLVELGAMLGELLDIVMKCYTSGPMVLAGEGLVLRRFSFRR